MGEPSDGHPSGLVRRTLGYLVDLSHAHRFILPVVPCLSRIYIHIYGIYICTYMNIYFMFSPVFVYSVGVCVCMSICNVLCCVAFSIERKSLIRARTMRYRNILCVTKHIQQDTKDRMPKAIYFVCLYQETRSNILHHIILHHTKTIV